MDTNAQKRLPEPLVAAALALAVLTGIAGIRAIRDRQALAAETVESAALRLEALTLRGSRLRDAGRYKEAEPLLTEALTVAEKAFGPDSLETAGVLNQIGMLGKYNGDF